MNIRVDGFKYQQSPGEIMQDFWLMSSCSTTSREAVGEACLLHKPGPAAGCHLQRTTTGEKLPCKVNSSNRDGTWTSQVPWRLPSKQVLQQDGGLSCQLLARGKCSGEKPQSLLDKGPISRSGYQTPACLVDWSFHCRREVYRGWRVERAISKVGVEGRGFLDINITKNSVLCNKESSLTGVYYKMFDIFQEHDKIKTQVSLHWMFSLFTRLGGLFFPLLL